MRKSVFRIIIIIIMCLFLTVGALVTTSIVNSKNVAIVQAEKSLAYMSEKYAVRFNSGFENAELIVSSVTAVVEKDVLVRNYINSRENFENTKKETEVFLKNIIQKSVFPMGLYITFDPDSTKGKDEIWYVKRENGDIVYVDSIEVSEDWLAEEDDTTEYYFKTIREGSYWSDAGYDPGMDGNVITYTEAAYDRNGELIGVVGADIVVDDLFNSLNKIQKEIKGSAVIIDKDGNVVAGKEPADKAGHDYIRGSAAIGDKWELVLTQPVDVAIEPILKTEATVILLGILILAAVILLVIYFSRKKVQPMINEAELKDALIINQARQARMGEMVGNIAHQWKQPLNNMKMSLSNMQNDYDNGALNEEEFSWYTMRIDSMINSLSETVDDFTSFLRPARKTENFSVNEEIKTVINMMNESIKINSIQIKVSGPEVQLDGYRNEFSQCLFNLIDNARDAVKENTADNRLITVTTAKENSFAAITVFNNGSPVREADKEKLFDLYFTTKEEKEGTGIGLYLTKEIIEKHFDGRIWFENTKDGVQFIIRIPLYKKEKHTQ